MQRSSRPRKVWLLPSIVRTNIINGVSSAYFLGVALLLLALVLGGSSQEDMIGNVLLQAAGVLVLVALLPRFFSLQRNGLYWFTSLGIALFILVPLIQLLPLPESIWSALPGRNEIAAINGISSEKPAFRSLTLSPSATLHSLFFIVPAIAVFISVLLMNFAERRKICVFVLAFAMFSVFLGALQLASGSESPLYFYSFTNNSNPVGFFSNRNHLAALLYCAIPFAIAFILAPRDTGPRGPRHHSQGIAHYIGPVVIIAAILLLILGVALTASRAGVGLAFIAMIGAILIFMFSGSGSRKSSPWRYLVSLIVISILITSFYALDTIVSRISENDIIDIGRKTSFQVTAEAIRQFFPFGSGMGTFRPVYKMFESVETVRLSIMNKAHNDFMEWLLEAGILAVIVFIFVLLWLFAAILRLKSKNFSTHSPVDYFLARAAILVPFLLLAHSAVDYPLRTGAIAALVAMCCAMTIPPPADNLSRVNS